MSELQNEYENLIELLEDRVQQTPEKIAYIVLKFEKEEKEEISLTYKDVYDNARAIAVSLKKRGLTKGDRVIILSSQTCDNIYSIYGAIFAEAIFTIIPPPTDESKKQRFKSVLESSEARFILYNDLMAKELEESLYQLQSPEKGVAEETGKLISPEIFNVENYEREPREWVKPEVTSDTFVCLQYSSGSTNHPKGIIITHGNIISNLEALMKSFVKDGLQTSVSWVPIFHNMGLMGTIFANVYYDIKSVIMSPVAFMENPLRWFRTVTDYKGNMILSPNSSYEFCTKVIDDHDLEGIDLSTVKLAINGSEPVNFNTLQNFANKFGKCGFQLSAFWLGYGLAESTAFVSAAMFNSKFKWVDYESMQKNLFVESTDEKAIRKQIMSVGKPFEGMKTAIVDPNTGKLCWKNEIGEIWLQSSSIAAGYWKMDKDTEKTFKGTLENKDGTFLRTGDLGTIYEDEMYIVGRLKELIIINGHNIIPHDIAVTVKESIPLLRTSTIISFAVNIDGKERFVTCVEVPNTMGRNFDTLAESINKSIYSVYGFSPYDIVFVKEDALPRTDNKKIQILKAREFYETNKLQIIYNTRAPGEGGEYERKIVKPADKTEEVLISLFNKVIESHSEISADDNFFAIGGDSLAIVQLSSLIEKEFKALIPIKYLMETPTVQGIAEYLKLNHGDDGSIHIETDRKFLYKECYLDESIIPGKYEDTKEYKPENIFITGSTGFVAAYLIQNLMELTDAKIYCHVRAKNDNDGYLRIKNNMEYFKIWDEKYSQRVIPIVGDLSKPMLGMNESLFNQLSEVVDTIYHSGALLNFIYPYSFLKNTNIVGTIEALRFACKGKAKYFHHVSTFSVFDNPSHFKTIAYEDDLLQSPEGYYLGYTESKWVAEKLVRIAEERGLKVAIYRPGEITGASTSGIWKMNDMVSRFFVAGIQMGALPNIPVKVHITPVDYVSGAIAHLSLKKESLGHAFHLVNKNIKTIIESAEILNSCGYNVKLIPYSEWKERLVQADQNNALKLLESLFFEEKIGTESISRRYADMEAIYDVTGTNKGLEGTGISCAPVNKELMSKYLNYFTEAGYIKG